MDERPLDSDKLAAYARHLFGMLDGAVTSALVHLGDALGLYRALADGPASSEELASRTSLHERWLREWLYNQAAAGLLEHDEAGRFGLSPEARAVLADEEHPAFSAGMFSHLPTQMGVVTQLQEAFRTGRGLPYDAFGPEGAVGVERGFSPWVRNFMVPVAVPAVAGLRAKLDAGARVVDVGCGGGVALLELAKAFPGCELHGYELSQHALERARRNAEAAGVHNVAFHDVAVEPLPADGRFDLALTFDCLHDMAHPDAVMAQLRRALADDGVWLIADIKAYPTFEENVERNPMAAMMYGFSVLSCMSSALSDDGGAGLGTLGLHTERAQEMTAAAGFRHFVRLDIDHPVNAFYEVRP
jgi:SAM-dependent methyltransferase